MRTLNVEEKSLQVNQENEMKDNDRVESHAVVWSSEEDPGVDAGNNTDKSVSHLPTVTERQI